jgi:tetratricopeptide (TPR) repeat protein
VTFPVLVDETGQSSTRFGFKAVPNGVLIDPEGTIRWAKYGSFSVENDDDVVVVQRFFTGEPIEPYAQPKVPYRLSEAQSSAVGQLLQRGHELVAKGQTAEAIQTWRQALDMDPENLVIRKQIWAATYPEKFHPLIDWNWQKIQLQKERAEEVARGVCGPDGCPWPPAK